MNTLPTDIEQTFVTFLKEASDAAAGGFFKFLTGGNTALEIRPGHTDNSETPEAGLIICHCAQDAVQQQVIGVNCWSAKVMVDLVYPIAGNTGDTSAVSSFQRIASEMDAAFNSFLFRDRLNALADGVYVHGLLAPVTMQAGIDEETRLWTWEFNLAVSSINKRPPEL